jgi:hypothetical protein
LHAIGHCTLTQSCGTAEHFVSGQSRITHDVWQTARRNESMIDEDDTGGFTLSTLLYLTGFEQAQALMWEYTPA